MSMITEVARAIWAIQRLDLDKCDMELEDVGNHYETYDMAVSVIEAMREPTKKMRAAMDELAGTTNPVDCWYAAIDVALGKADSE